MNPFLKWAGGKRRLLPQIKNLLPSGTRLVEPFMGSGAVFLGLEFDRYLAADVNNDLVSLYSFLKADGEKFIDECEALFGCLNTSEDYAQMRNEFNSLTVGDRRRSAIFVYLNRHGFNGLCRYNSKGGFNVPYGKMKKPYFPRDEMLGFVEKADRVEFKHADFRTIMEESVPGDVIYCDPPYAPLNETSSFASYATGGFSADDQEDLAILCWLCADRGIPVVLSNHETPFTQELYRGAHIEEVAVTRSISAKGDTRGKAPEVMVYFPEARFAQAA